MFIELTNIEDEKLFVNTDQILTVVKNDSGGSVLNFILTTPKGRLRR